MLLVMYWCSNCSCQVNIRTGVTVLNRDDNIITEYKGSSISRFYSS